MAEEDQQPAPSEDHSIHHGGMDQQPNQQTQGGGMMGGAEGGMMGAGQRGMGDMMGGGKGGMMGRCPMMGGGMGGMMMGSSIHGMMMGSVPMMEGRLAYIKADLGITADEEQAWNAYADAVRARHKAMENMHADMTKARQGGNAVDHLDARIQAMEAMVDSLKALKPATWCADRRAEEKG
jgi:hypothetical protein